MIDNFFNETNVFYKNQNQPPDTLRLDTPTLGQGRGQHMTARLFTDDSADANHKPAKLNIFHESILGSNAQLGVLGSLKIIRTFYYLFHNILNLMSGNKNSDKSPFVRHQVVQREFCSPMTIPYSRMHHQAIVNQLEQSMCPPLDVKLWIFPV